MKKLILTITVVSILFGASAFAGSCDIPKFIKKGAMISTSSGTGIVVEIDKKACWIKLEPSGKSSKDIRAWININTLEFIKRKYDVE